jgi:diguanylate cyclase (GGDEF)-like protein
MRFKATHDTLTGIANRGAILEMMDREIIRSRREGLSLGVLIADLDHFKLVNDNHGHLAGDDVLREVTRRMQSEIRPYDAVGRYGGEEFLILLPGCGNIATAENAERLRRAITAQPIQTQSGLLKVSISVGAVATGDWPEDTANQFLQMADAALYKAKERGRDQAVMATAAEHQDIHAPSLELSSHGREKT